ncbi:cell wall hydrolase [Devosia marina]|nr:cell wall hydrolase [Devosia marina]
MTIIAEALGEGPEGMRRVGETILNRAAIRGLTPEQVVRQPYQYTGFSAPGPAAVAAQKDPRVISAAEAAWELARRPGDPTNGADHYHADNVSPYWAAEMPSTGSFGRHDFYASQPVPAEALARLLVPETRNAPLPRARPASPMDQIAAMFAGSFDGSGQRQDTAAGLDEYVQRSQSAPRSIASNDMVFGSGIVDSHNRGASAAPKGLADLLEAFVRPKAPMTTGVRQTYAAQDAAAPRPAMHAMNGDDRGEWVEGTIIPLRQPSSGVGQPPATRTVQSVPVPRQAAPQMTTAQIRADNGQTRQTAGRPVANPQSRDSVALREAAARTAAMFGFGAPTLDVYGAPIPASGVPYAANSVNNDKDQRRLTNTAIIDRNSRQVAEMHGIVEHPQVANVTMPTPVSQRPQQTQQSARVAVTQPPRRVPFSMPTPLSQRPASSAMSYIQPRASAPANAATSAIARSFGSGGQSSGGDGGGSSGAGSFQGVSSGRTYNAGQRYSMGGDTYVANANGSFTNERTGRTLVGSSGRR